MKKLQSNLYRCSCCNEVKKYETNKVYKLWTNRVKPENSPVVAICRKCNNKIKNSGFNSVEQYLQVWGE